MENSSIGAAFLIGRGHSAGHRLLLVPDIAADPAQQSQLLQRVASAPDEIPQVIYSGDMAIVYVSHPVTTADLRTSDDRAVQDQPGRPLVMYYGFVVAAERVAALDPDDLDDAWQQAIACYRAFLQDEQGFAAWTSKSVPLRSKVIAPPPAQPRRRLPAKLVLSVGAVIVLIGLAVMLMRPDHTPQASPSATPQASPSATPPTVTVSPARTPGLLMTPAPDGTEARYLSSVAMPGCPQEAGCMRWMVDPAEAFQVTCQLTINNEIWYVVKWKDQTAYVPAVWTVSGTTEAILQCTEPSTTPAPTAT